MRKAAAYTFADLLVCMLEDPCLIKALKGKRFKASGARLAKLILGYLVVTTPSIFLLSGMLIHIVDF